MRQERYCVIENEQGDEYAWHYTLEKAQRTADKLAAEDGRIYRVDLNVVDVTREGVSEPIDSEPDLYATTSRNA